MGALAKAVKDIPPKRKPTGRLDSLDADDQAAIISLHVDKHYSARSIAPLLKERGFDVSGNTILEWLRGKGVYWS